LATNHAIVRAYFYSTSNNAGGTHERTRKLTYMIPPVLAATYLDPEYQVLLTEEQRNSAKIELQAFCL